MDAQLSDLFRLLHNLIRFGAVAEVRKDRVRIRSGGNTGNWIRWIALRAGQTRTWSAPSIGEQAVVLSPGGDTAAGVALVGIYSDQFPAPSLSAALHTMHYADGAVIEYNHESHALLAALPGGTATIKADSVTADAPQTNCTGDMLVGGDLVVAGSSALNGGVNAKAGAGGGPAMRVEGIIDASEDVVANGISVSRHDHGGVNRGNDRSDGPR